MEVEAQSAVLDTAEAESIVEGTEPQEAVLPSDAVEFEVPEKFKGKSIEDVIKSYQELEKMKATKEEEVVQESTEGEEPSQEPTDAEVETYTKYAESFEKNGALSEAEYAELAEAGYDKATVDKEIEAYKEQQEFQKYKQEKVLNDILAPLGGGKEKFQEVAMWANESKPVEEVKAFNEALATANTVAKQAMLRGLYAEYAASAGNNDTILHTSQPQVLPSKGYKTQEEFFKDIDSPEYKNNPAYRAAIEKKMSVSNIF